MRVKVKGQRRTYRYYSKEWVNGASLSVPDGGIDRPPCNYKFGPNDLWGEEDGKVYYARHTHTGTPDVQSRAMGLMQRMNAGLSEAEWKGHWVYTLAQRIFWNEWARKNKQKRGG